MTTKKGRRPSKSVVSGAVRVSEPAEPAPSPVKRQPRIASITISDSKQDLIGEALASAASRVDVCIVVDCGITDRTIEAARVAVGDKLRVCQYPRNPRSWFHYANARNAALDFAREDKADWAVIVDTDERIDWRELDLRPVLADARVDVFWMNTADGVYIKEKIVRLASDARFIGDTHEVLIARTKALLPTAVFDELPRTPEHIREKFARDVPVLMDMVSRPEFATDGRWWHYLGDSQQGLGNVEAAIQAYARSVELRPGPSEDAAFTAYQQARCLCIINKFREALDACVKGMTRHAGVAELPWLAAYAAAQLGWDDQAAYWARMSIANGAHKGRRVPRSGFTDPPALFENPYDVLRHKGTTQEEREEAEREFHIAKRARLGAKNDEDLDRLGLSRTCRYKNDFRAMLRPQCIRQMVGRPLECWPLVLSTKTLNEAGIVGYNPLNPSLCAHKGKLLIVVRTVNYRIENGRYMTPDADAGRVRTVNFLGRISLDEGGPRLFDLEYMRDLDEGPRQPTMVLGYEDIRLFSVKGKLWGSATVRDRDRDRCQIALLEIGPRATIDKAHIQTLHTANTEKNWMPIVGDEIRWIYGLDPTTTVRKQNGHMEALPTHFALDHLRGGSQVIPFDDGWIAVMHEAIYQENWGCRRIYLHRFVRFDKKFRVVAVSRAFVFEPDHYGIEFCSTLVRDPKRKDKLVLGYGVEDREAKLLVIDEADVRELRWWTAEDCK